MNKIPWWIIVGFILLVIILFILSFALVLGVALGLGWILTRFLSFSLAEASVLGVVVLVLVIGIWLRLLRSFSLPMINSLDEEEDEEPEQETTYKEIPAIRFYKTPAEKTWEAWLRYELANDIYLEFQDDPRPVANLGDGQMQELCIRLADVALAILRAKTGRAERLRITKAAFARQMGRMGQRAYDDDITEIALAAINSNLEYYQAELVDVIRDKAWNRLTPMFDEE